jgi:CheY-like chemotaxis protein
MMTCSGASSLIEHESSSDLDSIDESVVRFVRRILKGHRYQVIEACDGAEALDLASAHEGHEAFADRTLGRLPAESLRR